jgi:hypothetical protein
MMYKILKKRPYRDLPALCEALAEDKQSGVIEILSKNTAGTYFEIFYTVDNYESKLEPLSCNDEPR